MVENKINDILKSWNPLDVPDFIAEEEYQDYISEIKRYMFDEISLKNYLINVLENNMGITIHSVNEIDNIVKKIVEVRNDCNNN